MLGKCRKAAPSINWESIMKLIEVFVFEITQVDGDSGNGRYLKVLAKGAHRVRIRGKEFRAGKKAWETWLLSF